MSSPTASTTTSAPLTKLQLHEDLHFRRLFAPLDACSGRETRYNHQKRLNASQGAGATPPGLSNRVHILQPHVETPRPSNTSLPSAAHHPTALLCQPLYLQQNRHHSNLPSRVAIASPRPAEQPFRTCQSIHPPPFLVYKGLQIPRHSSGKASTMHERKSMRTSRHSTISHGRSKARRSWYENEQSATLRLSSRRECYKSQGNEGKLLNP